MSVPKTFLESAPAPGLLQERPVPDLRQQELRRAGIGPPAALWVDENDILQLQVRNSLSGAQLEVVARIMEPDGRIMESRFSKFPATDGSIDTTTQALYYGYLLSASVSAIGSTLPNRGQTYCVLKINRHPSPSNLAHYVLAADYVSGTYALGWPGGRIVGPLEGPGFLADTLATVPAAGADWSISVTANQRWKIRGGQAQLVTAIAVANRQVSFIIDDGVSTLFTIEAPAVQAASLTQIYDLIPGDTITSLISTHQPIFLPAELALFASWRIRTSTGAIQAADQWSAIRVLTEQWVED